MSEHTTQLADWNNAMTEFVMYYRGIPVDRRQQTIADDWSARQTLEHLLESELVFATRMRMAIADPGSKAPMFDQDLYSDRIPTSAVPDDLLLDALAALRSVNLAILRALPAEVWSHTIEHPENGSQTLETIAAVFGNHVSDHLDDLKRARSDTQRL